MTQTIDPAQARRTNRILWACLILSLFVYAGIGAARVGPEGLSPPPAVFAGMLGVMAVPIAVGAHVCWRRSRGAGRAAHEPPPALQVVFTSSILAWVLDESIAVFGLALAFLGAPAETWAPFSAAALALMLIHRPA